MKLRLNDKLIIKAALLVAAFCAPPTLACDTVMCATKHGDWEVIAAPHGSATLTSSIQGGSAIYVCELMATSCTWSMFLPGMDCKIYSEVVVVLRYNGISHLFPVSCIPSATAKPGRTLAFSGESDLLTQIFLSNEITVIADGSGGKSFTHTFSSNGARAAILLARKEFAQIKAQNAKPYQ